MIITLNFEKLSMNRRYKQENRDKFAKFAKDESDKADKLLGLVDQSNSAEENDI